ncbi:hypothetical protein G3I59_32010 [Amycolatopsis rubida]|uniref:Uncharacterized protein n=1 Tax=Amycolatopsis rubida TaxID=112413 RepID=A0ABX0C4Z3_9PSEU|nr:MULTISPECIES: hypothetical protein [Amycolatopsis]MYW92374.1 hypothetical protein [Amycolatopsis rubida]MYW95099.1 hypothetical protein [Amycolatopsis rubida]NEC57362.1 hypothetical protein [Amycolatopsis rubida]NEC60086.1 hypothetical protein [Amycolatopsis rubida]OAP24970.1 hypothetical protein A4R44_04038 [Amycolatopsis sp. M39]
MPEEYRACLDADEYEYEYHGGYWDSSPAILEMPCDGRWCVVEGCGVPLAAWVTKLVDWRRSRSLPGKSRR